MAKVQNLSLNPTKYPAFGRLMCCLKYENDIYYELRKGMPEVGEYVKTADGMGVVQETSILENRVAVRLVLEEKTKDKPEKLSNDLYTYKKQEIKRIDGKTSKNVVEDIDEALLDEIKDLLKD